MALFDKVFRKRSFGMEGGPLRLSAGPIREALAGYEPFLLKGRPRVFSQAELPVGITRETAIESLAASPWATQWAEGMLRLAGVQPTVLDYERRKRELARRVAERMWD